MIRPVVVKGLVLAAVACVAMSEPVEASITRYRVTNRYSCQGQRALWEGEAEWRAGAFGLCLLEALTCVSV